MYDELKVFSGRAGVPLCDKVCNYLNIEPGKIDIRDFSDGEIWTKVDESVRGADCFIIQPTCGPVNDNFMELMIIIDAMRRSSARRITAIMPYFGYARQDRKDQPHVPLTAKLCANLVTKAGADRVLTIDLHADQIQGFFDIPCDHLLAVPVIVQHMKENINLDDLIIVSPDTGSAKRARNLASKLGTTIAICDKKRYSDGHTEVMYVVGDVKDKVAVIVDDLLSTGGTLVNAAESLKMSGAKQIFAYLTHGVLAGDAIAKIEASPIEKVYISDTIPLPKEKKIDKIEVLSVAPLIAEAIWRTHKHESVSTLYI